MAEIKDKLITAENLKNAYDNNKNKIDELKGDLVSQKTDATLWEKNSFNVSTGEKQANGNFIRTKDYLSDKIKKVTVPDGGIWGIYCFAWENDTYVGAWRKSTNSFIKDSVTGVSMEFTRFLSKNTVDTTIYTINKKASYHGIFYDILPID